MTGYAELQVTTNYSFLRGASHPEELFAQAKLLGLPALGITDRNSLAGIVALPSARRGSRRAHAGRAAASISPTARPSWSIHRAGRAMRACAGCSQPRQEPRRQGWLRSGLAGCGGAWRRAAVPCCCPISRTTRCDPRWRGCGADFGNRAYLALTCAAGPGMRYVCIGWPRPLSPRACRRWRPATCSTTRRNAACCRM